jgi:AcrR family transcriptional regulator
LVREYSLTKMAVTLTPAAERIARAAMRLFGDRGYDRTSVADIHQAVGLAPGSGSLYKHFSNKRALLEAGLEREFAERDAVTAEFADAMPFEPREALAAAAAAVLQHMQDERDLIRVTCRDLEQFPELLERVCNERIQPLYDLAATWLDVQTVVGRFREHDAAAVAAVAWGALVYYRISEALVGEAPGRVAPDRFIDAWVDLLASALERGT